MDEVTEELDISQYLGEQMEDLQLEFEWDEWEDLTGFGENLDWQNPFED
jgi:hypothetical protein